MAFRISLPRLLSALLVLALALPAEDRRLRIVTTTTDLADITRSVAGDLAVVRSVASGREDPHFLNARPGFVAMAREADLWIRVGMELESGWEGPVIEGSRNNRIRPGSLGHLDVSRDVLKLDVHTHGHPDRSAGHVHPAGNPHYWLDPYNGRVIAKTVAERLVRLRPEQAETVRRNLAAFLRRLDERMFGPDLVAAVDAETLWKAELEGRLDGLLEERGLAGKLGGWKAALRPFRGRPVITYHKSWVYFLNRFGLVPIAEIEPKPGVPPTASHLAALEELIRRSPGKVLILQEPFYSPKAGERLSRRTGAAFLVAPSSVGALPEASDYITLMDLIVRRVAERL